MVKKRKEYGIGQMYEMNYAPGGRRRWMRLLDAEDISGK